MIINDPTFQCLTNNYIIGVKAYKDDIKFEYLGFFQFGHDKTFYTTKNIKMNY